VEYFSDSETAASINASIGPVEELNIRKGYNYINLTRKYLPDDAIPTLTVKESLDLLTVKAEDSGKIENDLICIRDQIADYYHSCSNIEPGINLKISARLIMDTEKLNNFLKIYMLAGVYNLKFSVNGLYNSTQSITVNETTQQQGFHFYNFKNSTQSYALNFILLNL
jgi:hypothetical protein